jgi:hypothetical protein
MKPAPESTKTHHERSRLPSHFSAPRADQQWENYAQLHYSALDHRLQVERRKAYRLLLQLALLPADEHMDAVLWEGRASHADR